MKARSAQRLRAFCLFVIEKCAKNRFAPRVYGDRGGICDEPLSGDVSTPFFVPHWRRDQTDDAMRCRPCTAPHHARFGAIATAPRVVKLPRAGLQALRGQL